LGYSSYSSKYRKKGPIGCTQIPQPLFAGGIFNLAWNPHSQLAGCSAGNYALIFAHFAELGGVALGDGNGALGVAITLNNRDTVYIFIYIYHMTLHTGKLTASYRKSSVR
jgi:hypothetical protein